MTTTVFTLDEAQLKLYSAWDANHKPSCKLKDKQCAIGGRVSFRFTPTGIGVVAVAKCACGDEYDLTDYETW